MLDRAERRSPIGHAQCLPSFFVNLETREEQHRAVVRFSFGKVSDIEIGLPDEKVTVALVACNNRVNPSLDCSTGTD